MRHCHPFVTAWKRTAHVLDLLTQAGHTFKYSWCHSPIHLFALWPVAPTDVTYATWLVRITRYLNGFFTHSNTYSLSYVVTRPRVVRCCALEP